MEKKEILEKVQTKKAIVGEMEKTKIDKSNWIAVIVSCVVAVALIVVEGALGHFSAVYAIAAVCFCWASVFYFCQYFIAKRPWPVLIGAVLEALGGCIMIANYVLVSVGVIG